MADREDLDVSNLATANIHVIVDEMKINCININDFVAFCVKIIKGFYLHCCAISFVCSSRFFYLLLMQKHGFTLTFNGFVLCNLVRVFESLTTLLGKGYKSSSYL